MSSLGHHSGRPLTLVRHILEGLYQHPLNWVRLDEVADMADAPTAEAFQTALGFAVSTGLLKVDDAGNPPKVCLTAHGLVLAAT